MIAQAKVISLHWEERETAIYEATLEVEHANGDRQLFVIPICRMTDRLNGEMKRSAATEGTKDAGRGKGRRARKRRT